MKSDRIADAFAAIAQPTRLDLLRLLLGLGEAGLSAGEIVARLGVPASTMSFHFRALEQAGHRVLMVGDGTNDAPAMSTATVGLALAGHGGGVVAEAADVVLLVDDPGRVPEAVVIGRRSLAIARQSIAVGLGLSLVGMGFAAAGQLTPVAGALLQEAIDVAVILNALRAATDGPSRGRTRRK